MVNPERRTKQREVILEELRKVCSHPTADELFALVRRRMPRVSLATVYRNLDRMARDGAVLRIESGRQCRYDGDTSDHAHVRCVACGKVGDLAGPPSIDEAPLPLCEGFTVTERRVEYRGVCAECGGRTGRRAQADVRGKSRIPKPGKARKDRAQGAGGRQGP